MSGVSRRPVLPMSRLRLCFVAPTAGRGAASKEMCFVYARAKHLSSARRARECSAILPLDLAQAEKLAALAPTEGADNLVKRAHDSRRCHMR